MNSQGDEDDPNDEEGEVGGLEDDDHPHQPPHLLALPGHRLARVTGVTRGLHSIPASSFAQEPLTPLLTCTSSLFSPPAGRMVVVASTSWWEEATTVVSVLSSRWEVVEEADWEARESGW